ncbi:hypothetical protein CL614_10135 [archaeon]|nr:hypothetical protein [archaeon]
MTPVNAGEGRGLGVATGFPKVYKAEVYTTLVFFSASAGIDFLEIADFLGTTFSGGYLDICDDDNN